jgi:cobyrinic acid a,c-diamide synthase
MGLVIAGDRSGVGKTTVTLALLASLRQRGYSVQSFKVGPDYIDPMFHQVVTGRPCRNLDPVLTSEAYVQQCFAHHTQTATYAVIEGVMGLFDGAAGQADFASTAHIARLLNLPVLLVLDCSRLSHSIAALVHGYRTFDPRLHFAGVVLNRVGSDRHLALLRSALEPLHLPILGILRRDDRIQIPDRHLGLVPTAELPHLAALLNQLTHLSTTCFDWSQLLPLVSVPRTTPQPCKTQNSKLKTRIAIAQDLAFSFYYADNLDRLTALGAELIPWSPLQDAALPEAVQGLYFGGGFPEMFAQPLAANEAARKAVQAAIWAGMPTYAECGGLMYLGETLTNFAADRFPMVGVLPTMTVMGSRLVLGYRHAIAQQSTPLLPQGATVWGHEFHRSHTTQRSETPLFTLSTALDAENAQPEGWYRHQVHASYLHLHWGDKPEIPHRFLQHCTEFDKLSYI